MDSFELNKIVGAVLFTLLVTMSLGIVAEAIYTPEEPEKPGFAIEVPEEQAAGGTQTAAAEETPIAVLLASASAEAGADVAKKCVSCHTFGKGEPAKVGPNLYGVVTGPIAHMAGFKYSAIFTEKHEAGDTWTYENLNHFLHNPKGFAPGTAMGFAGLKKDSERANMIAYLRSLSDNPPPLPTPEAAPAAEQPAQVGAEPAEGAPPAEGTQPAPAGAQPDAAPPAVSPASEPPAAEPAAPATQAPAATETPADPAPAAQPPADAAPAAPATEPPAGAAPSEPAPAEQPIAPPATTQPQAPAEEPAGQSTAP
ncbi:c-type cytochrome [Prosthecomicrobium pneumaticum]|uniref:Cytochrome c n=1 Tax=Prosthecomicrobium pneumaticum TaxID=81895 RepID=A0A7W9FM25_9HYPH|nr:cytochrome c family protein [Prosthecomicrobium pneumaticum]MBB5753183.1 cytochrome c [Prosthecomicrobium pneumaticum]